MNNQNLVQRIRWCRDDAFQKDRNTFQALHQVLISVTQVADEQCLVKPTDEQIGAIIRQHISIYADQIAALNNPPEGSGAYSEYVDLQQRIFAIEAHLPAAKTE